MSMSSIDHRPANRPWRGQLWPRPPTPPEYWSDATLESAEDVSSDEQEYDENDINELNEPVSHQFKVGENVWIRLQDRWYHGQVKKILGPQQSKDHCIRYMVYFRNGHSSTNLRANFDPRNGSVQPDTAHVRDLLRSAGWLVSKD